MLGLVIPSIVAFYVLAVVTVVRAARGGYFARFPYFFSYVIYLLFTSIFVNLADVLGLRFYVTLFWLRFFSLAIAEFALLVEIGVHIFRPYPAIRELGKLITLGITLAFSAFYILPVLMQSQPSGVAIFEFMKRSALTKGIIIVALLAVSGAYGVRLGRNITGLTVGLAAYLAINTANFALAESYGRQLYGPIFSTIGPLSQTLCVLIWTVALWRPEPDMEPARAIAAARGFSEPLPNRLGKFNTVLTRLFRK